MLALARAPMSSASQASCRPYAIEDDAFIVDERQLPLVLPQRGRRSSTMSNDERVGQAPRNSRVLDPAELHKLTTDAADIDQRLGRFACTCFVACTANFGCHDAVDPATDPYG